jgi:enoyl-CoA hydratase/carnithine racemase
MDSPSFELSWHGAVAEIRLARPAQRNALDTAFWRDFPVALERLEADPSLRAVLIGAAGPHFCSGMDLDFFPEVRKAEGGEAGRYREWLRRQVLRLQAALNRIETLRVPVIVAAQGACVGAGLDLACAASIRLCSSDAFFCVHEINIGMTADLGVLQRLPRLLPPGLAHELAYTGRRLEAAEALACGFVNRVLDGPDELLRQARALAERIAAQSPLAVAGSKFMLNRALDRSVADGLELVSLWNAAMFVTEDVPRALAAQKDRTRPAFRDVLP